MREREGDQVVPDTPELVALREAAMLAADRHEGQRMDALLVSVWVPNDHVAGPTEAVVDGVAWPQDRLASLVMAAVTLLRPVE